MAEVYRVIYSGQFCDKAGETIFINFKRRMQDTILIPVPKDIIFTGEDNNPIVISYKDDGNFKNVPINGSEATFNIKATDGFELRSMYTADEREWKVEISGAWIWHGFIIPDSCSEPFIAPPYDVTIRATDMVGTLKDIPYSSGVNYTGFANDITTLNRALAFTNINIPLLIAVNTLEVTMIKNGAYTDPLQQTYIDQDRFKDLDNNAFSCEEVIRSVLERWGARLHQWNGNWQIVNVLEKQKGNIQARRFSTTGVYIDSVILGNQLIGGGENRNIRPVGSSEISKALASSTAYYQYGYPSNELVNGDFQDWPIGNPLPVGWQKSGDITVSRGVSQADSADLYVALSGGAGWLENIAPIQMKANQSISISFDLFAPNAYSPILARVLPILLKNDQGFYYTKNGWVQNFAYYSIIYPGSSFNDQKTIRIEIDGSFTSDWRLTIGLLPVVGTGSVRYQTNINNVAIRQSISPNQAAPPLGVFNRQKTLTRQSYVKNPILLLHGDDTNAQRTSRILINNIPSINPLMWSRSGYGNESLNTIQIAANSELTLHQRPYQVFEADFIGYGVHDLGINTLLSIDLIEDPMIFLSGDFNLKKSVHSLRFAQVLTQKLLSENVTGFDQLIQDYGGVKTKDGVSVGAPSGISPGGGGSTIDTNAFIRNQDLLQAGARFNVSKGVIVDLLVIPSKTPIPGGLEAGQSAIWIGDLSGIDNTPGGYVLPIATSTILGGITVGNGLTINPTTGKLDATGGESPLTFTYPLIRTLNNVAIDLSAYAPISYVDLNFALKNGSNASGIWNINISGRAEYSGLVDNGSSRMAFEWIDGGVQPTWVWGSVISGIAKVYNPASFNVNSATYWGGRTANFESLAANVFRMVGVDSSDGVIRQVSLDSFRSWAGSPSGGETLQSVTDRNNKTTNSLFITGNGIPTGLGIKGLGLSYESSLGGCAISSYDWSSGSAMNLFINPSGGNIIIGYTIDQGYKLAVNGSLRSTTAEATDAQFLPNQAPSSIPSGKSCIWIGNLSGITP